MFVERLGSFGFALSKNYIWGRVRSVVTEGELRCSIPWLKFLQCKNINMVDECIICLKDVEKL